MADRILVRGIRFYGHHGVDPSEQEIGQWYRVDLDLFLDLHPAGTTDALERSVDYSDVCRRTIAIGSKNRFRLIEALAERIAEEILSAFPVERVRVRVVKPAPSELLASLAPDGRLDYSAVEIDRP